jgi:hypothetical protein
MGHYPPNRLHQGQLKDRFAPVAAMQHRMNHTGMLNPQLPGQGEILKHGGSRVNSQDRPL